MNTIAQYNEEQIGYLLQLQAVDKKLDSLEEQRGNLPEMVTRLQEMIEEIKKNKATLQIRVQEYTVAIVTQEEKQREATQLVEQYENDQQATENPQEYKLIAKNLEVARLDLLLAKKKIRDYQYTITREEMKIEDLSKEIEKQTKILLEKQKTLQDIDKGNEEKMDDLSKKKEKIIKNLHIQFYSLYKDIREKQPDVLAKVVDEACDGCYLVVPPQIQADIQESEKIITCETCCRILVSVEIPVVEEGTEKVKRRTTRKKVQKKEEK